MLLSDRRINKQRFARKLWSSSFKGGDVSTRVVSTAQKWPTTRKLFKKNMCNELNQSPDMNIEGSQGNFEFMAKKQHKIKLQVFVLIMDMMDDVRCPT